MFIEQGFDLFFLQTKDPCWDQCFEIMVALNALQVTLKIHTNFTGKKKGIRKIIPVDDPVGANHSFLYKQEIIKYPVCLEKNLVGFVFFCYC
ncbi:hypothetical protein D3C86_1265870 [compost metagenome]